MESHSVTVAGKSCKNNSERKRLPMHALNPLQEPGGPQTSLLVAEV